LQVKRQSGQLLARSKRRPALKSPLVSASTAQKNRGGWNTATASCLPPRKTGKALQRHRLLCAARRWGYRKGKRYQKAKPYEKTHYYILSRPMSRPNKPPV
jgi:hypothetical protein